MPTNSENIQRLERALASPATPENFKASMKQKLTELKEKESADKHRSELKKKKIRKQGGRKIKKKAKKQRKAKKAMAVPISKAIKKFNRGRSKSDLLRDKQRSAKKPGKRISASGGVYYENRANRADRSSRARLYKGGSMYNGGGDVSKNNPSNQDVMKWSEKQLDNFLAENWGFRGVNRTGITRLQKDRTVENKRLEVLSQIQYNKDHGYSSGGQSYNSGGGMDDHNCPMNKHSDTCGCSNK